QSPTGSFGGMLNLGPRPTFGETTVTLEAHLFDAEGDWYGQRVRIDFVSKLRDVRRFADGAALAAQLRVDEQMARVTVGRMRAGL
ncbi:MAG: riboflavin kinase, partial [Gemmatimonadetes bacterium]|nr:riboflavin kinase [Gemmatimonadota bacterium]